MIAQKKIIIVGATSGLGKEMAILYCLQNHLVGITGRRKELLEELQQQFPLNIKIACFDVAGYENNKQLHELIHQLGGLDLFIYNAGYGNPSSDLNWETEEMTTRINVNGFVEMMTICFNYFLQQGYGKMALTSSIAALRGNSWAPAYSASKAYMSNYAESLNMKAHRLKKNIVVTDIKPGFLATKKTKAPQQFWVTHPAKAARQIMKAIEQKRRVVYVSKRWCLIALLLKLLPFVLYKKIA